MIIPFSKVLEFLSIRKGVLALGACEGEEAKMYTEAGFKHQAYIEANPELMDALHNNIIQARSFRGQGFWHETIDTFNVCLSDRDNSLVDFHLIYSDDNTNKGCSSILPLGEHAKIYPCVKLRKTIQLRTRRLDSLLSENGIDANNYNFISMDLQGAELLALKGATETLKSIDVILTEFAVRPLYENACTLDDLDNWLKDKGFNRVLTEYAHELWGDCVYRRIL